MRSFEIPTERWLETESKLRGRLEEIERLKRAFPDVRKCLDEAVERLRRLDIGLFPASIDTGREARYSPVPQAEALAFARSHGGESSEAGYRKMVLRIIEEHDTMRLSCDLLKEMHRCVCGAGDSHAGQWKTKNNYVPIYRGYDMWFASRLTTLVRFVPHYMESLDERFDRMWKSGSVHPLLLIAAYSLDLLYIHPFSDGNGRVVRLAILLLLHQCGHSIGGLGSLESAVARRRTGYNEALLASMQGWEEARHDLSHWGAFLLRLVRDVYDEISRRTDELAAVANQGSALSEAINEMPTSFRSEDLRSRLPGVPEYITRIVLNRMREAGKLEATVLGPEVEWRKAASI